MPQRMYSEKREDAMANEKQDRILRDEEADDLYQMEIDKSLAEVIKAQAYSEFLEYCRQCLIDSGSKTIGDLPVEVLEIISRKHVALTQLYGPAETLNVESA